MQVFKAKKLVLVAIIGYSVPVSGMELKNPNIPSLFIGGHFSVGAIKGQTESLSINSLSPRINLVSIQSLTDTLWIEAKGEWGVNSLGGSDSFATRLGYIALAHDSNGSIVFGKQWSPYYVAGGVADKPIAFANEFLYDNQGPLGTARADSMISYTNIYQFADFISFKFGFGWQGASVTSYTKDSGSTEHSYDLGQRVQTLLAYEVSEVSINYAFSSGNISSATEELIPEEEEASSHLFSVSYGQYGTGVYLAGVIALNSYMNSYNEQLLSDTKAYEAILAYGLSNGLNVSLNSEWLLNESSTAQEFESGTVVYATAALQVEYDIDRRLRGYGGYQLDLQGTGSFKESKDNILMLGVRFFL
ncbi:porin [Vibrio barjaei]|uniref:Porin n=1 Tax=Vibrio barjaei TaxID=1676683 RepID=A0ABW7IIA7_9VIBR